MSVSRVGLIAQSGAGAATLVGKALAKRKPVLLIGGVIALVAALVPLLVLADDPTAVQAAVAADTVASRIPAKIPDFISIPCFDFDGLVSRPAMVYAALTAA